MTVKEVIEKELEKQKEKKLEKIKTVIKHVETIKYSIYEVKHDINSIYVDIDLYNTIYELEQIKNIDELIEKLEKELEKESI